MIGVDPRVVVVDASKPQHDKIVRVVAALSSGIRDRGIQMIGRLGGWLGVPTSRIIAGVRGVRVNDDDTIEHCVRESTSEMIEAHLKAARNLDEDTAAALSDAFRRLYEVSRKKRRK